MTYDASKFVEVGEEEISEPAAKRRRIPNTLYNTNVFAHTNSADTSMDSTFNDSLNDSTLIPSSSVVNSSSPSGTSQSENATRIELEAEFKSFAEFKAEFEAWKKTYNHPFRVASSETLKDANGNVDTVCHYRYIVYQCAHYGQPRKRGNGSRPNQNYLPCGCEAMLRVCYHFKNKTLRISQLRSIHSGHSVTAAPLPAKTDSKPKRRYSRKSFSMALASSPVSTKERSPSDGESSQSCTPTETSVSSPETKSSDSNDYIKSAGNGAAPTDPQQMHNFYNNLLALCGKVPVVNQPGLPDITTLSSLVPFQQNLPQSVTQPIPQVFPQTMVQTIQPNMQNSLAQPVSQSIPHTLAYPLAPIMPPTTVSTVVAPSPVVPNSSNEPSLPISTSTVSSTGFRPLCNVQNNQAFIKIENFDNSISEDKENRPISSPAMQSANQKEKLSELKQILDEMLSLSDNIIYDYVKLNRAAQIKSLYESFISPIQN